MSAVKTNKVQIGQSVTPGLNITIECPATPDGSFKIRKGAHDGSGVVLFQVDTSGNPTYPTQTPRTWQVMTGSRALTTNYTNNTGRDIEVQGYATNTGGATIACIVNSIVLDNFQAPSGIPAMPFNMTVPAGAIYSVTVSAGTAVVALWNELRP